MVARLTILAAALGWPWSINLFTTAISSDSIWGKTEVTVGIGTLGHITGLVGIQRLRLHWLAVKCLIAGLFKRLSQFHISVKMD